MPFSLEQFVMVAIALVKIAASLGLTVFIAQHLRGQWLAFKARASSDGVHNFVDSLIAMFGDRVDRAIDLIEKGEVAEGLARLKKLQANLPGKR